MLLKKTEHKILPKHIAIIMDGNGRWAKKRALPRSVGHSAGAKNFKTIARYCNSIGIRYLTVYAFSTENWNRPAAEVEALMNLLRDYFRDVTNFTKENIVLRFIGDRFGLPQDIQQLMQNAEELSKNATGLVLNLAINYGGRNEIIRAVQKAAKQVQSGALSPGQLTEQYLSNLLDTAGQPDPDLIIRPSGELRLSNFLTWQSAYAELWFSDVLWPDFKPRHLEKALQSYAERNRRFGGV